jgi:alkanesulfonate monooxygenase SsuD/methylene tetrahydromethanopterin reductase-like flavin-dependent oxidoreductase (luciferase family)
VKVRVGYGLGTQAPTDPASLAALVDELERLRFDSLWLSERLTGPAPDPVVGLAFAAARTTHLKFGTSVMVLPGRNPVVLAKELATLDRLSGGRLLPAFGLGVRDPAEQQASASSGASGRLGSTKRCRCSGACGRRTRSTTTARGSRTGG